MNPFGTGDNRFPNPLGKTASIPQLVDKILQIVVDIGIPVLVLAVVYVGFLFVTARGNEEQLKKAKQAFLWTVIGAAIVLGAKVISEAIQATIRNL